MIQYSTVNVKLSNSLLTKLKLRIKNGTKVSLNPSSNVAGNSNYGSNFSHNFLLLIITQVSRLFQYTSFVKLLQMVDQLI